MSVDGEEIARFASTAPEQRNRTRWDERSLDLARFANRTVEVTFGVDGDLPGVFGAPALRDATYREERPNVLLVSIDTLRADRLGSYGYENARTPRLDAFAERSVRFANVRSQAPYTLPSHTSMLSGQVPSVHGIQMGGQVISNVRSPLLPRILSERGYRTLALTGGGFLNADFGFDKGFDGFTIIDPLRQPESKYLTKLSETDPARCSDELIAENGVGRIHEFLRESRDEPFFLFLHTYTVHDYDPPASHDRCAERGCTNARTDWRDFRLLPNPDGSMPDPVPATEDDRQHLSHRYDDALTYVDELLGTVFDELDRLGLRDDTIVVVTTDHGEEMLERGFVQHGKTLYEEVTRIPLIVAAPGLEGRVEPREAMTIDIVPTVLQRMAIPAPEHMQGIDLFGADRERPIWSEIHDSFVNKLTLREDGWKLIHNPPDEEVLFRAEQEFELYDLSTDPDERNNLAASRLEYVQKLREKLDRMHTLFDAKGRSLGEVGSGVVDNETQAQLKDLGY